MTQFKKILLINMAVLVAYTALFCLTNNLTDGYAFLLLAMLIAAHFFVAFIISLVMFGLKNKVQGQAFLLSAGLILVIGFSACFGIGNLV